jgi:hypothetical protein
MRTKNFNINKIVFLLSLIFIFLLYNNLSAQSDTTSNAEDSIIYVYEEPLVVKQTVQKQEVIFNRWFLEMGVGLYNYSTYNYLCNNFADYESRIKSVDKPTWSNTGFVRVRYLIKKNTFVSFGLSAAQKNESFNVAGAAIHSNNYYRYIDLRWGAGYWWGRQHKHISVMMSVEILTSKLVEKYGYTINYLSPYSTISLKEAGRDSQYLVSGRAGVKVIFFNNRRYKFFVEPYSQANINSTLKYKDNYFLQYWIKGVEVGFMVAL